METHQLHLSQHCLVHPGPAAATSVDATHTRRRPGGAKSGPGSGQGSAGVTSCKAFCRSALISRRCTEGSRHTSSYSWRSLAAKLDPVVDAMLSQNTNL